MPAFLTNPWVKYFTRSYTQIKEQILTNMQTRVPEITDHTESNLFVKIVSMFAGIAEMLAYYIDNAARESFITTCRRYVSAIKIARLMDYQVHGKLPASVNVTFVVSASAPSLITIPIGTEIKTQDNIRYFTTELGEINIGQTECTVAAIQQVNVVNALLGTSTGAEAQEFKVSADCAHGSIVAKVNSLAWAGQSTFGFSTNTDSHFVATVDKDKNVIIIFGDGMSGAIPASGATITADYRVTAGAAGNVDVSAINIIVSTLTLPGGLTATVTNRDRASGGSDVESLSKIKKRIPLAARTMYRAVSPQDYIDVTELCPGVAKAGHVYACGKFVDIYIVPDGGGIASSPLLATCQDWMDLRKMITTRVRVFPAGEVHLKLVVDITALPNYSNTTVHDAVELALTQFLSFQYQDIRGQVQLSDIYQVIEGVEGVQYSNITVMTTQPYARPLDSGVPVLNWTRATLPASNSTVKWRLVFLSNTSFQLFKNNSFAGVFNVGSLVTQTELTFTVGSGSYVINDSYEFVTYPYFGTVVLQEPSLPVAVDSDLTLIVTGGV